MDSEGEDIEYGPTVIEELPTPPQSPVVPQRRGVSEEKTPEGAAQPTGGEQGGPTTPEHAPAEEPVEAQEEEPAPKKGHWKGFGLDLLKNALSRGKSQEKEKAAAEGEEGTDRDDGASELGSEAFDGSLPGMIVDPQARKPILMSKLNQSVAALNVALGTLYLCWRVFRGFNPSGDFRDWQRIGDYYYNVDDPGKPWSIKDELQLNWFGWLLLFGEAMLMVSVWFQHCSRLFPTKRVHATMNELVEVDLEVSRQTQVCVILPSRGEELAILREAILGIMSLHLWPGKLDVRRNVRLVVVDDHRRPEVKMLVSLCYRLATMFYNNRKIRAQLKTEGRAKIGLSEFFEYFLQCTAGFGKTYSDNFTDVFELAEMISKMCKDNAIPEEWEGLELPQGVPVEPKGLLTDLMRLPRVREDFDDIRSILSVVYFTRSNAEEPKACVLGGILNSVLFPEDQADEDLMCGAQFVVVHDPLHALKSEFLQRTMPYFFKLKRHKSHRVSYEICPHIAFVQVPLRFPVDKNKDPLANQDLILHDVKNLGRDGIGASWANFHGAVFRVDVLKSGKDSQGNQVVPEDKLKEHVGKDVGFSTFTSNVMVQTCVTLFQRGFRSVYVYDRAETLSLATVQTTDLDDKVQEVFDQYRSAAEVLYQDPWALVKSPYATFWHRLMVLEELCYGFFMSIGVELILVCVVIYCCIWRRPFFTHGIEVLLFFLPYYISAALPTALIVNWKRTPADPAFRSVQLSGALAFVPLVAYVGVAMSELSRVLCSRTGKRQFTVEGSPTWPLFATLAILLACGVVSFIYWAKGRFRHAGMWVTSMVMLCCVFATLLPAAMRGVRFKGIATFYLRYFALAVLVVVVAFWQQAGPKVK